MGLFAEALEAKLDEKIQQLSGVLARGAVSDWPEYRKIVGIVEGLEIAKRELRELVDNMID